MKKSKTVMVASKVNSTAAKAGIQIKNTFENTIPSLAKKTEGLYYGSKDGNGLMEGEAKRAIFNSIYKSK